MPTNLEPPEYQLANPNHAGKSHILLVIISTRQRQKAFKMSKIKSPPCANRKKP